MTIDGSRMQSRAGYSVYDGWKVQGWPRYVIRRGQIVLADGSPSQGGCVRAYRNLLIAPAGRRCRIRAEPLIKRRGRVRAEHPLRVGLRAAPCGARAGKRGYAGAGDRH
jgi:hypothetical protein